MAMTLEQIELEYEFIRNESKQRKEGADAYEDDEFDKYDEETDNYDKHISHDVPTLELPKKVESTIPDEWEDVETDAFDPEYD